MGAGSHGTVRILVDTGSGPSVVAGKFRFKEQHWLVPGMDVSVTIDPAAPDKFEIDWDAVASMEDRAAANDPTLADPHGARRRVAQARGVAEADVDTTRADRFEQSMQKAAQAPAPEGKVRAVVLVATIRGQFWTNQHTGHSVNFEQNSAAVLAVNVPGRDPYALFVHKFRFPRLQHDLSGAGLPALVSAGDPNDVEILWDEVPSAASQIETRMADSVAGAEARNRPVADMQKQIMDAVGHAETGPPAAIPAAGGAALGAMAPQMRQMAADNARRTLKYIQDPAQRKMLIAQYRAAGILEEGDEGL
jgi:hypothetical protein